MMSRAYAPYSGFFVGAALLCSDGAVFTGCNVENAAFSPTCCAERTAVFKAVSEGHRSFSGIAVAGGKGGRITDFFMPCGVCRQVLREFCGDAFPVLVAGANGEVREYRLSELLPAGFGAEQLREKNEEEGTGR